MSSFTEPLVLTPAGQGRYRTVRPFSFDIGLKGSGLVLTVPADFVTDLASVPRAFWWLLPPYEPQYAAAAVLHDYLCTWDGFDPFTAHSIFYDALRVLGVGHFKARVMFLAVVLFGTGRR